MRTLLLSWIVLGAGCFGSGGSDGGSGGASAGGTSGAPQGTGGTSAASGAGASGSGGATSVGTTGGVGAGAASGAGGAAGVSAAGAGGNACCPCPDQPQPAGCLECDLFCPGGEAGTGGTTASCGGNNTCPSGQQCCPQGAGSSCVAAGTCVPGKCAAPDTPIATPSGERPIAELRDGDLVLSLDHGAVVAVPLVATRRVAVTAHAVARIELRDGRVFEMSAGHPTTDGRTLGALAPGDALGDASVASVSMVPYTHPFTHDILPASDTGAYFAAGALVGSTLAVEGSGGR